MYSILGNTLSNTSKWIIFKFIEIKFLGKKPKLPDLTYFAKKKMFKVLKSANDFSVFPNKPCVSFISNLWLGLIELD